MYCYQTLNTRYSAYSQYQCKLSRNPRVHVRFKYTCFNAVSTKYRTFVFLNTREIMTPDKALLLIRPVERPGVLPGHAFLSVFVHTVVYVEFRSMIDSIRGTSPHT